MYQPPELSSWTGRVSEQEGRENLLWHQVIEKFDLTAKPSAEKQETGVVFLGFCSDEGVRRNRGREGAVTGPDAIRKAMSGLAVHHQENFSLMDGGNVVLSGRQLEFAQKELARKVIQLIQIDLFPIILGGGHEVSYGHALGVINQFQQEKVGVINFDPHFDLRSYVNGGHSGSWARQLMDEFGDRFQYFPIGINPANNMASMFDLVKKREMDFITMEDLLQNPVSSLKQRIDEFLESIDLLVITLDLDVFSAGIAPGVSAPAAYGAWPQHIIPLLKHLMAQPKVVSMDVAEMNPTFDDGRTAKLAAQMIFEVASTLNIKQ